jgi:hypothetical protein
VTELVGRVSRAALTRGQPRPERALPTCHVTVGATFLWHAYRCIDEFLCLVPPACLGVGEVPPGHCDERDEFGADHSEHDFVAQDLGSNCVEHDRCSKRYRQHVVAGAASGVHGSRLSRRV